METSSPPLGYVPGYDYYETYISNYKLNSSTLFHKKGSAMIPTGFPEFTYSITDRTLQGFQSDVSVPYDYQTTTWLYENAEATCFWVNTSSSSAALRLTDFPDIVKQKYPQLDISLLELESVIWVDYQDSYNYNSYTDDIMSGHSQQFFETFVYSGK
jgi:hypothetical protein